jgi:HK97 family phage major capsid protein
LRPLTYVSREAYDDSEVDLTHILARSHARAIALVYGSTFTTTILANLNNGGTATALAGYGTATGTFLGFEALIDLEYGRAAEYRGSGSFVTANGAIKLARKWKDGQGQYLWTPGINLGQPAVLDGRLAHEDPALTAPGSATKSVVFGDLAAALIAKATPIRVEVSRDFLFDKDQVAIKTVQRIDLQVQDPAAAAYLVSANT